MSVTFLWCGICTASAESTDLETVSDLGVEDGSLNLNCKSAILMEATTGAVLYAQNPDEALPPASVTKIMTLLLVMEAIDSGTVHMEDPVTVSANAASMGGSQVYLKEGEQMSVEDMLKSVVIASANDAAVALSEHIAGTVPSFVDKMNAKAKSLGMTSTVFENVTGLDDTAENHLTSARDIALMSRALIAHPTILNYSSIWMDSIRNGEFGLTNTNRLVRFYKGCTGLKTGSTSKAGFCVSATAERDDFSLICVIMGAESRDIRNATATQLLDWGFSNYALYRSEEGSIAPIRLSGGVKNECALSYPAFSKVVPKSEISSVEKRLDV
ncbi:MAG: D-alanyl-D-alanine carboxypeptidase, partial [Clostridia bacterium]|nr:D-alanyl-D-alanine carboxypeptidase [Clostridia bacterium]